MENQILDRKGITQGEIIFKRILSNINSNATGYVQFVCFFAFITDRYTAEQVINFFRQFAEKSDKVGSWIKRQMDMQGILDQQLDRLLEHKEAAYQFQTHLEKLERINQQIQKFCL